MPAQEYNTASTAAVNGLQQVDATHGFPIINLDAAGAPIFSAAAALVDAAANPTLGRVGALPALYNGATWDRQTNNQQGTLLASAARTVSTLSPVQTNYNARGLLLYLNVTAASGTGGLSPRLQVYDPVTGGNAQIASNPTGVISAQPQIYIYYPGATVAGGFVSSTYSIILPRQWSILVVAGDASSYTYSLGYSYIV